MHSVFLKQNITDGIIKSQGSSHCDAVETNPTRNHEVVGLIPGLAQWIKNSVLCELWFRSQMWLRSCIAVALA